MPEFDVEKEAEVFCAGRGISSESGKVSTVALLHRAIAATEERVERECAKATCRICGEGYPVRRSDGGPFYHNYYNTAPWCTATAIHERRRRREQG